MKNHLRNQITEIKHSVHKDQVICGLSGGVDSTVTAAIISKAINKQLTCIYVDTGLMRLNETKEVVKMFKKHFKSYTKACKAIGLEPLLNKPMPKDFTALKEIDNLEMLVDTREQDPLPFKKTNIEKLYVGDYLIKGKEYTYTYVDRKSESDFLGTMSGGISRFKKELEKAVALESYLFVVIESSIDSIKKNQSRFRRKINLEYIFHNMRDLMHEYPRKIQFVFTGSREKSLKLIPLLLYHGKKLWDVDVQYYLDHELGNR